MTDSGSRPLPLDGLTVLDLGQIYQGPYAGFLLAQAGADVIKVEPPAGDPTRGTATGRRPMAAFAMLNSNKRSVVLDLKSDIGKAQLVALARTADVLLENYAPGVLDKLGVGADVLTEANPRLVYASGTGFGLSGPNRDNLAMDVTIQAFTGVMSVTGYPENPPVKSGAAFIDFLGGVHLYAGIVTALVERERTGRGRVVETAMADAVFPTLASNLGAFYARGETTRTGNKHGALALTPYDVYETADGFYAMIVINERQWAGLCVAMGQPELAVDERFADNRSRVQHMAELDAIINAWGRTVSRDEAVRRISEQRVPVAPVRDLDEVTNDAHFHERGTLEWQDHPESGRVAVMRSALRFHGSALPKLDPAPTLGAHTDEVLGELS